MSSLTTLIDYPHWLGESFKGKTSQITLEANVRANRFRSGDKRMRTSSPTRVRVEGDWQIVEVNKCGLSLVMVVYLNDPCGIRIVGDKDKDDRRGGWSPVNVNCWAGWVSVSVPLPPPPPPHWNSATGRLKWAKHITCWIHECVTLINSLYRGLIGLICE